MTYISSFEPIADPHAKILILGSMPGNASLIASQYYAHKQNAFWRIMSELLQFELNSPYEVKTQMLKSARIALWDVLKSCKRVGSLDSNILPNSQTVNNFQNFFQQHQFISKVCFNGSKAENCFNRYFAKMIHGSSKQFIRLPSTSPANASIPYEEKLKAWQAAINSHYSQAISSKASAK